MADITNRALEYGIANADRLFNRRGHGETKRVSERHLSQAQVAALLAIAFDAGLSAAGGVEPAAATVSRFEQEYQTPAEPRRLGDIGHAEAAHFEVVR